MKLIDEKEYSDNSKLIKIDEKIIQEYNSIDGDVDDYIFAWQTVKFVSER